MTQVQRAVFSLCADLLRRCDQLALSREDLRAPLAAVAVHAAFLKRLALEELPRRREKLERQQRFQSV
jgi:hypothetical protein